MQAYIFESIPLFILFWVAYVFWFGLEMWYAKKERGKTIDNADKGSKKVLIWSLLGGVFFAFFFALSGVGFGIPGIKAFISIFGIILMILGTLFRLWSVMSLGNYFRRVVMVQKEHKLVTSGPYHLIRHPAYIGTLLTVLGIGVALGNMLSIAACILGFFIGHMQRISIEEKELQKNLPGYKKYMTKTKRLIPFVY